MLLRQAGAVAPPVLGHRSSPACGRVSQQQQQQPSCRPKVTTAALGRREVLGGLCGCSACCACGTHSSSRNQLYDKYFAFNMKVGMDDYEAAIRPVKSVLFQQLFATAAGGGSGQVQMQSTVAGSSSTSSSASSSSSTPLSLLEVGIGTGPNLSYYLPSSITSSTATTATASSTTAPPPDLTITGLDPNSAMFGYAREAAAVAGLAPGLQLVEGDAQQMPFANNSFDAAVMTLVLCSVPQPPLVLSELLRVLKPSAPLLLIEHVIAPQLGLLQLQQRLLNPLQRLLADNCHLTRDTASIIRASAFVPQLLPPLPLGKPGIGPAGGAAAATASAAGSSSSNGGLLDGDVLLGAGSGGGSSVGGGLPGGVNGSRDLWRFEVEGMSLISPHVAGILTKPL